MATISDALITDVLQFFKGCHLYFFSTNGDETGYASTAAADVYPQSRIYTPVLTAPSDQDPISVAGDHVFGVRPGQDKAPQCSVRPENAKFLAPLWHPTLAHDERTEKEDPDYTISDSLSGENSRLVVDGDTIVLTPSTEVLAYPGSTDLSLCATAALWYCAMNRVYHYWYEASAGGDLAANMVKPNILQTTPLFGQSALKTLPFAQDVDYDPFYLDNRTAAPQPEPSQGSNAKSTVPNVLLPLVRQLTVGVVGSGANVEIAGKRVVRFVLRVR